MACVEDRALAERPVPQNIFSNCLLKTSNFSLCASTLLLNSLIIFMIITLHSFLVGLPTSVSYIFSCGFYLVPSSETYACHFILSKFLFVFLRMW